MRASAVSLEIREANIFYGAKRVTVLVDRLLDQLDAARPIERARSQVPTGHGTRPNLHGRKIAARPFSGSRLTPRKRFSHEKDEFDWACQTPAPSPKVRPFRVAEAKAHLECEVAQIVTDRNTNIVLGRRCRDYPRRAGSRSGRARLGGPLERFFPSMKRNTPAAALGCARPRTGKTSPPTGPVLVP